eukprot:gb/GECG01010536.1/.p1 GENE.gb/GECG01010536.1/~~gb/GECG01010536.1/.p1  ORF type:complete len:247 (+),score=24.68 gb/GECG01010536.1/:1-741(+)
MFEMPTARSSLLESISSPSLVAYDLTMAICSIKATKEIAIADGKISDNSLPDIGGAIGFGRVEGTSPITLISAIVSSVLFAPALDQIAITTIASTTVTSGGGSRFETFGRAFSVTSNITDDIPITAEKGCVSSIELNNSPTNSCAPVVGAVENPNMSPDNDRTAIIAAALTNPLRTGLLMKLTRNPSLNNPRSNNNTPTIIDIIITNFTYSVPPVSTGKSLNADETIRATILMGPIEAWEEPPKMP